MLILGCAKNVQIPALVFMWKLQAVTIWKALIKFASKHPRIPLFPWNIFIHKSDFHWGFFSLPHNPISVTTCARKRIETGGVTRISLKCQLVQEMTPNKDRLWNNSINYSVIVFQRGTFCTILISKYTKSFISTLLAQIHCNVPRPHHWPINFLLTHCCFTQDRKEHKLKQNDSARGKCQKCTN